MRGVSFGAFANGTACLCYRSAGSSDQWDLSVYHATRAAYLRNQLRDAISEWVKAWEETPDEIAGLDFRTKIFLPTERSLFTRLSSSPSNLYSDSHPEPFKAFAQLLFRAGLTYDLIRKKHLPLVDSRRSGRRTSWFKTVTPEVLRLGQVALKGEAYLPVGGPQAWRWQVHDEGGIPLSRRGGLPISIPIEATASGQSEAWPLFVVCAIYGWRPGATFYIEEPEAHLHPKALVQVVQAIALMIRHGCRFVVTTHSPFLLFKVNNLLQVHESGQDLADDCTAIAPEEVAAYRMDADGSAVDILDRADTHLIDAGELNAIADQLGREFEELLYQRAT